MPAWAGLVEHPPRHRIGSGGKHPTERAPGVALADHAVVDSLVRAGKAFLLYSRSNKAMHAVRKGKELLRAGEDQAGGVSENPISCQG